MRIFESLKKASSKGKAFPSVEQVFSDWRMLLAFGLGSGLSRITPGTVGTLAAVPLFFVFAGLPVWLYVLVLISAFLLGIYVCQYASDQLQVHDHGGIVWDEFVGYWLTMIALPVEWPWVLAGFILFRFFDMVKPWPIGWFDKRIHGGFGIMFDDVVAALMAAACLHGWRLWGI